MFVFSKKDLQQFDTKKAGDFVSLWAKAYDYAPTAANSLASVDYFAELNLGNALTADNLRNLLRWKDPRMLTDPLRNGRSNPRVTAVLNVRSEINGFRSGSLPVETFRDTCGKVFPKGLVWQVFLFHVARPAEYPIADQHVFRTFDLHTGNNTAAGWGKYDAYKDYFFSIAAASGIQAGESLGRYVRELKKVDNALMVFGQFLKKYG